MLPDGELSFVPRRLVVEKLRQGWSLLPGHDYSRDDYAFLMRRPDARGEVFRHQIERVQRWFAPRPVRSNKSAAGFSRAVTMAGRAMA